MEQAKQIEEKRVNTIPGFRGNVAIRTTIPSEPNNSIEVAENTSSSERLTRNEMLDSIRELQDRNADKATISLKDLKEARAKEPDRFPRESEIYREFKSFNHAKELAGVSVSRQGRRTAADRWTKKELLNYLKEIAARLDRLPTVNDLVELRKEDPSLPSHQMIAHPFRGSLEVALKEAGLIKSARKPAWKTLKKYGGEEGLLDHLRSLHQTLGRTPTADDVINARKNDKSKPTHHAYYRAFGTLNKALQAAGIRVQYTRRDIFVEDPARRFTREELVAHMKDVNEQLGRSPSKSELTEANQDNRDLPTVADYLKEFGGLEKAYEAAGISPYVHVPTRKYTRLQMIRYMKELSQELGGMTPTADVISAYSKTEHDAGREFPAMITFTNAFGSIREAQKAAGLRPNRKVSTSC